MPGVHIRASERAIVLTPSGDTSGAADYAMFSSAAAAIAALGGGDIVFADGVYYTNKPLVVSASNTHLRAQNRRRATVRATAGWSWASTPAAATGIINFLGVDFTSCRGLRVDGRTNSLIGNGIQWVCSQANGVGTISTNYQCIDNFVTTTTGHCYAIWSLRAQYGRIAKNTIDGGNVTYVAGGTQEGIEIFGGYAIDVVDNVVDGSSGSGIFVQSLGGTVANSEVVGVTVYNNRISRCRDGVSISNSAACAVERVHVIHNTIDRCWTNHVLVYAEEAGSTYADIAISGNIGVGATTAEGAQSNVSALRLNNVNSHADLTVLGQVSISGNMFRGISHTASSGAVTVTNWPQAKFMDNHWENSPAIATGNSHGLFVYASRSLHVEDDTYRYARASCVELQQTIGFGFKRCRFLNWNLSAVGYAAFLPNANATDFTVVDCEFDTTVATSIGQLINLGYAGLRRFLVAGNRYLNLSSNRGSIVVSTFNADLAWASNAGEPTGKIVRPTSGYTGWYYETVITGTSGTTEPTWPTSVGATVTPSGGTCTYMARNVLG